MHQKLLDRQFQVYLQKRRMGTAKEWIDRHVKSRLVQEDRLQLAAMVKASS